MTVNVLVTGTSRLAKGKDQAGPEVPLHHTGRYRCSASVGARGTA
jgi:hypothetical protein